jgi:diacylglycerol kinase
VHFFFAALVVAVGFSLGCSPLEWCILLGCIGMVLTVELFRSAIEAIYRGLDVPNQVRVRPALNIAAGALLMASTTAAIVGAIVCCNRLWALFG